MTVSLDQVPPAPPLPFPEVSAPCLRLWPLAGTGSQLALAPSWHWLPAIPGRPPTCSTLRRWSMQRCPCGGQGAEICAGAHRERTKGRCCSWLLATRASSETDLGAGAFMPRCPGAKLSKPCRMKTCRRGFAATRVWAVPPGRGMGNVQRGKGDNFPRVESLLKGRTTFLPCQPPNFGLAD